MRFKTVNIRPGDRSLVWKLSRQRYYQVPLILDGAMDVFEVGEDSQVIAKYLDSRLGLGLFPSELDGVQALLWRHIESDVEDVAFRLNDAHWREFVAPRDQLDYLRHKERKFGRGCLDRWRREKKELLARLAACLLPYEQMLLGGPFLLGDRPRFVDFDLFGMLGTFLNSGHYDLPRSHGRLRAWHGRMAAIQLNNRESEKLRS